MILEGRAIKYGDDVNTDVIIPGRYLHLTKPEDLISHTMEDLDPDFLKKFTKGDIIVAGKNFGCGSSREQAVMCLKYVGVGAIIAKSFARIFFRNAINQGLPVIESFESVDVIDNGNIVIVDIDEEFIKNETKNLKLKYKPFPKYISEIIKSGGLVQWIQKHE